MIDMLERTHLAIIREVNRRGTLTAAAETLCLSQSALSHSIKKLEQQLGIRLWTKEGRHLYLTQAGQYLLSLADRLLPQFKHAEQVIGQFAGGQRGVLRIGMECHPCYRWLLKVICPFFRQWPNVDVDVKKNFQFAGITALVDHEIDLLVTPDPIMEKGLVFTPVFDYELVLAVSDTHPLAGYAAVGPKQLCREILITYPVEIERLDIYSQFFVPAHCRPKKQKAVEDTDIMLQMVAAGRGVTALPSWLVDQYAGILPLRQIRLGAQGIQKQIFIGTREAETAVDYISGFIELAKHHRR